MTKSQRWLAMDSLKKERIRERPRCRKVIMSLVGKLTLTQVLADIVQDNPHKYSDGMRTQARKMTFELIAGEQSDD